MMSRLPVTLDRYRCLEVIGEDETSTVYRAEVLEGPQGGEPRAVRRLSEAARSLPGLRAQILERGRQAAGVRHPVLAAVREVQFSDGELFVVSDLVEGAGLGEVFTLAGEAGQAMPWNLTLEVTVQIAEALRACHDSIDEEGQCLVHGAVSPCHVRISDAGGVRLLDPGVAASLARAKHQLRAHGATEVLYQAPEQLLGEPVDGRADLFALGALLFEMLAGRRLFELDGQGKRRVAKGGGRSLGEEGKMLRRVLRRLLPAQPAERIARAEEVVTELQEVLQARSDYASPLSLGQWVEQVEQGDRLDEMGFDDEETVVRISGAEPADAEPADAEPSVGGAQASAPPMAALRPRGAADDVELEEPTLERKADGSGRRAILAPPDAGVPERGEVGSAEDSGAPERVEAAKPEVRDEEAARRRARAAPFDLEEVSAAPELTRSSAGLRAALLITILFLAGAIVAVAFLVRERQRLTDEVRRCRLAWSAARARVSADESAEARNAGMEAMASRSELAARRAGGARATKGAPHRPAARAGMEGAMGPGAGMGPEAAMDAAMGPGAGMEGAMGPGAAMEDAMGPGAGGAPPRAVGDLRPVPRTGKRRAGEVDVVTAPRGVAVAYMGQVLGKTPLRLRGRVGKRYMLVLNRESYRVKTTAVRLSRYGGMLLRNVLAPIRYPVARAKPGRTSVRVVCRTQGVLRVFLNGRDSGRNCPVALKVGYGKNNVGVFLPRRGRTVFKYFRAKAGKQVVVNFPH